MGGFGPVLDVGAGTGIMWRGTGRDRGVGPIDGTDISPQMLEQARDQRHAYRNLFAANSARGPVPCPMACIKARSVRALLPTGTSGLIGIDRVLDAVRPAGWIVLSVNTQHYVSRRVRRQNGADCIAVSPTAVKPRSRSIAHRMLRAHMRGTLHCFWRFARPRYTSAFCARAPLRSLCPVPS